MSREPIRPYPSNAPGPFYVENHGCFACEAPQAEAPDLIEGLVDPCYFKRQPVTPDEIERAILACTVCCSGAVRYAGHDPAILEQFRKQRSEAACDALNVRRGVEGQAHPLWDDEQDAWRRRSPVGIRPADVYTGRLTDRTNLPVLPRVPRLALQDAGRRAKRRCPSDPT